MGYGVEIWGWKEREGLERLEERFLRWVLGVEGRTPWYMVREELQRDKLCIRAGRRAWGFERRLKLGKGSVIARKCWEEMRERSKRGKGGSGWEGERREFFIRKGLNWEETEERIGEVEEGERWYGEWEKEERERHRKIRREKISNASYNSWYKEVKGRGVPGYLKRGWGEERWSRIARFRLGNEVEERKYWEETEKKLCRLCGGGELETWEHLWERCREWREGGGGGWQEAVTWVLGEEGEGEEWMREVEEERKRVRRERGEQEGSGLRKDTGRWRGEGENENEGRGEDDVGRDKVGKREEAGIQQGGVCVCVRRGVVEAWRHAETTQSRLGLELKIVISVDVSVV